MQNNHIYNNLIYEYKNFLPLDIYNSLKEICLKELNSIMLYKNSVNQEAVFVINNNSHSKNILQMIDKKVKLFFRDEAKIDPFTTMLVYNQNEHKLLHSDGHDYPTMKNGILYYLNDDYEGGEVHYPTLNITIKPKANSLIIHPANLPHEVFSVKTNSSRIVLTTFAHSINNEEIFIG
jgi:hypothetical protein